MVRNILAVLDGGPGDASAHATAMRLARHGAGSLRILGISDRNRCIKREMVPIGALHAKQLADARRYKALRALVRKRADALADACAGCGVAAGITLADEAARTALSRHWDEPDLIILGRERRHDGTESFSPKALIRLLHDSPRPILVSCEAETDPFGTVAIAYDGSLPAEQALESFLRLGLATGRRLDVVCVNSDAGRVRNLARAAAALCNRYNVSYQTYSVVCARQSLAVLRGWLKALMPGTMVLTWTKRRARWNSLFGTGPIRRLLRASTANLYVYH